MVVVVLTQTTEVRKQGAQAKHGRTGRMVWLKTSALPKIKPKSLLFAGHCQKYLIKAPEMSVISFWK